jgi:hypothetical protein
MSYSSNLFEATEHDLTGAYLWHFNLVAIPFAALQKKTGVWATENRILIHCSIG